MHIKPKKRLGQNFLVDQNIRRKIIESCQLDLKDCVLEIGAGNGELTELIANKAHKVYALEIDSALCDCLRPKFQNNQNVIIINADILKFDLNKYFTGFKSKIKVLGNLPYYISSPIIEHLFNFRKRINSVFITVQKEYAARLISPAGSKDYGSFSCFIQYYSKPKIICEIKKTCFYPIPKVDSCFMRLDIKEKSDCTLQQEKILFKIIRASFNKRRKTLRNSLFGIVPEKKLESFFLEYGIDKNTRPEELTLEDFINLTKLSIFKKKD